MRRIESRDEAELKSKERRRAGSCIGFRAILLMAVVMVEERSSPLRGVILRRTSKSEVNSILSPQILGLVCVQGTAQLYRSSGEGSSVVSFWGNGVSGVQFGNPNFLNGDGKTFAFMFYGKSAGSVTRR